MSEAQMTETVAYDVIAEAMSLIDRGLGEVQHRELMSTSEVADLLLDVRLLLAGATSGSDEASTPEPAGV